MQTLGFAEHCAHHYYKNSITRDSVVLDLGANRGKFSKGIADERACSCIMVEASPELYGQLTPPNNKSRKILACIAREDRKVMFHLSGNSERNGMYIEQGIIQSLMVNGIRFDAFLKENIGRQSVDLLKIDIEGAEIDLIETTDLETLGQFPQVTCEFHEVLDSPHAIGRCISKMEKAGFCTLNFSRPYTSDVLFIHRELMRRTPGLKAKVQVMRWFLKLM